MFRIFLKTINPILFNSLLFIFLFLGIQNSNEKQKVFLYKYSSVEIPISFIAGSSFIFGSIYSNILILFFRDKK